MFIPSSGHNCELAFLAGRITAGIEIIALLFATCRNVLVLVFSSRKLYLSSGEYFW
jgi:hypothetical protein